MRGHSSDLHEQLGLTVEDKDVVLGPGIGQKKDKKKRIPKEIIERASEEARRVNYIAWDYSVLTKQV